MTEQLKEERLIQLEGTAARLLYWRYHHRQTHELAKLLAVSDTKFNQIQKAAFDFLNVPFKQGINGEEKQNDKDRWDWFQSEYGQLLSDLVERYYGKIQDTYAFAWPPLNQKEEKEDSKEEKEEPKDNPTSTGEVSNATQSGWTPPIQVTVRGQQVPVVWLGLGLIFLFALVALVSNQIGRGTIPLVDATPPIAVPTATFTAPALAVIPLTGNPTQTLAPQVVSVQTSTASPQPTLTWTPVPSITPLPVLIEENFENGLSSKWTVLSGEYAIMNRQLSIATSQDFWMTLDAPWDNYQISFKTSTGNSSASLRTVISTRFIDTGNFLGFTSNAGRTKWVTLQNGRANDIPDSWVGGDGALEATIIMTVRGNSMAVMMNGTNRGSMVETKLPAGKIAIHLMERDWISDFKIVQLPPS
jgi:hypothetical protein